MSIQKQIVKDFQISDELIAKLNDHQKNLKTSLNKLVMQRTIQSESFEEKQKSLIENQKHFYELKLKHDLLYNLLKIKFIGNSDQRIQGVVLEDSQSSPFFFDFPKNSSTPDMFWKQFE